MKMNRKRRVNEDVTYSEIRGIVNDKIDDFLKDRRFEKKVNELTAKAFEKFISQLFHKKQMWLSNIK